MTPPENPPGDDDRTLPPGDADDRTIPSDDATAKTPAPSATGPPETIGPYKIREKLGEGGFGEVYVADQTEPVKRRVALKILKAGMDTKSVLARFEAERQALSLMDHPNIAKVLDAGATEQGRSYFVMEMVKGEPITDYCDRHRLSIDDRLDIFLSVCAAVQHAHQKGLIHRDLKPSNILVTVVDEKPVPKVIDFGIAKATSGALTPETIYTMQGELMGTPEYMSPEQAEMGGLDVDTRADIYSLGVVLYELLSGTLPFDSKTVRRAALSEIHRIIREEEPPRPSTKLTDTGDESAAIAKKRHTEIRTLSKALKQDLDWIILKAMEKDRTRRYETANALSQEIRRYLNNEPLLAGPPSASYRFGKFARRHRAGMLAGSLVTVAILVGFFGMAFGLIRAKRAEEATRQEAATTEEVLDFMVGLFEVSDPGETRGNTITAREILDKGAAEIEGLEGEPLIQARLMTTMGTVYWKLGLYDEARPLLEKGLSIRERELPSDHPDVAASLNNLAILLKEAGDYAGARPLYERALAIWEKALDPDHPDVASSLNNLANLLLDTGDYAGARSLNERALAIREKALGPDHPKVAQSLVNLANLLLDTGDYAGARPLYERALAIREKALGPDHPDVAASLNNLANLLKEAGDYAGARPLCERSLAIWEKALGPDHPDVASSLNNLANLLKEAGDYAGARQLYERALAIWEKALGPDHPDVAHPLNNLAILLDDAGDQAGSRPLYERALAIREKALGPDHPDVASSLNNLAELLRATGDHTGARRLHERSLAIREKALGPDHPDVASSLNNLATLLNTTGDYAGARTLLERALAIREKALGPDHPDVASSLNNLAELLRKTGDYAGARPLYERSLAIWKKALGPDHPGVGIVIHNLGVLYRDTEDFDQSEEHFSRAQAILEKGLGPDHPYVAENLEQHAKLLRELGRVSEAEKMEARAKAIREKASSED